ncbi:glycosyl hydrolase [Lachnoclostridium sp.]|nr:glycosyl hydrolase [Lachnoclostridium sp.]
MNIIDRFNENLQKYKSIPFWSWNDKLQPEELRAQIREMKDVGMGGFFMHARGGLKTPYMEDEWFDCVEACIDEAKKLDMNAWCYDENGWPSGFAGMKLLKDRENLEHYITYKSKDCFDESALEVYVVTDNQLIRVFESSEQSDCYHCVYDHVNSSVVDVLNPSIVRKFIEETHEKYYEKFSTEFGNVMMGFFTDEPQYFRWDTAYTPMLVTAFKEEYGEDVLDGLASLFIEHEGAYEFRFKYWRLMNKLFINSFIKQIYDWCEEHNCKITGHAVEESALFAQMWCCAGIMPFYEYEHIPGMDWLGREIQSELAPRQVSSVAQQLGKKQVLTETFACTGWDATPKELKRIAEWQYVNGINLMCQHLFPYSIRGQRKRDYPLHFSKHNPWYDELKYFNDYFTRLGYLLTESTEVVKVGIIHPMHSAYLTFNRQKDKESVQVLEDSFIELIESFGAYNIGHHYIDESLLERHGSVRENQLIMGQCAYDYIVIPKLQSLDHTTVALLKQYLEQGGKLYLVDEQPSYIDGKKANLDFLVSNVTWEELINTDIVLRETNTAVRSTYRKSDFGTFLFAVNLSEKEAYTVHYEVKAKGMKQLNLETVRFEGVYFEAGDCGIVVPLTLDPGQSVLLYVDDLASPMPKEKGNTILQQLDTNFNVVSEVRNQLTIDYVSLSYDNITYDESMPIMAVSYRLLSERQNRTIYLKYEFEVKELSNLLIIEAEDQHYKNVWLNGQEIALSQKGILDKSFICCDIVSLVKVGKNEVVFEIEYYQDPMVYHLHLDEGDDTESLMNCLSYDTDIECIYLHGNFGVEALDGYEICMREKGEVVDVKEEANREECHLSILTTGRFTLVKQKKHVDISRLVQEGFLFFAGELLLEKHFEVKELETYAKLTLEGRFAFAEIILNGKKVKNLLFDKEANLSDYLIQGENILRIRLKNGNRNLLGPFHCANAYEPLGVGPETFHMYGTWDGSKSPMYRDSYSFVFFGVNYIKITIY